MVLGHTPLFYEGYILYIFFLKGRATAHPIFIGYGPPPVMATVPFSSLDPSFGSVTHTRREGRLMAESM